MHIVFASSEATPFSKTGGLADVASGLTRALARAGHRVTLITPHYPHVFPPQQPRLPTRASVPLSFGGRTVTANLLRSDLGNGVDVVLIDCAPFYHRPGLYTEGGRDYPDNAERFLFFSRAVIETIHRLGLSPDVVHSNDWQTGLVPALVKHHLRPLPGCAHVVSAFTIHNMAFQGRFPPGVMAFTGLGAERFNWRELEFYGEVNLLKAGIALADVVTTVSPTYAREVCTPQFGYGLDGVCRDRGDRLVGILNGIDDAEWNPQTDPHLARNYSTGDVVVGKAACKAALQHELGLEARPDALLLGMISRMTDQKGCDLIAAKAEEILQANVQFAFLGTGEARYEEFLRDLEQRHPGRVAARIGFDEPLAHRIEAGADAFLMPSRFEPCGLNQQYSLRYGTPPIVHGTGGLADSVQDASAENLENGTAVGFRFDHYDADSFLHAVWRCVGCFQHGKLQWAQIVHTGMTRDLSWAHSAAEYVKAYERAQAGLL